MNFLFPLLFGGGRRSRRRGGCCRDIACADDGCGCGFRVPIVESEAGLVRVTKSSDRATVPIGGAVEVQLDIVNVSAVALEVTVVDCLPPCGRYIAGSTAVNGVATPDLNPIAGIRLGVLQQGETITVNYSFVAGANGGSFASVWYLPSGHSWTQCVAETGRSNMLCVGVLR